MKSNQTPQLSTALLEKVVEKGETLYREIIQYSNGDVTKRWFKPTNLKIPFKVELLWKE